MLLLLKEQTKEYIRENSESLSIGTTLIDPQDIGVDISGYKIGIRKSTDGTIDAMITGNASNDLQAGKIASLLGVSAGIYSSQDMRNAWGINGVWVEDISSYGFTDLSSGIPVVTTAYDEEDSIDLEKIFSAIEEHKFNVLSANVINADQLCLFNKETNSYDCREGWDDDPIKIIQDCNNGDDMSCMKGRSKGYNHNCQTIANTYKSKRQTAPNQAYILTVGLESTEKKKEYCWFAEEYGFSTNEILSTKCKLGSASYDKNACIVGFKDEVNQTCQNVYDALVISELTVPSSGTYALTSDVLGNAKSRTCYFDNSNKKGYEGYEVIDGCNNSLAGTCGIAYNNNLNRTCQQIIDTYKLSEKTPSNGSYLLSSSTSVQKATDCWFLNTTGMSTSEAISGCENSNITACQIGYDNHLNRTCAELKTSSPSLDNGEYKLTLKGYTSSSVKEYSCDMDKSPAWTLLFSSTTNNATYNTEYSGLYGISLNGAPGSSGYWSSGGAGGKNTFSKRYGTNTTFKQAYINGGKGNHSNGWGYGWGGYGIAVYVNNVLQAVAGGGGGGGAYSLGAGSGGGGWKGGKGTANGTGLVADSVNDGSYGGRPGPGETSGFSGYPFGGAGGRAAGTSQGSWGCSSTTCYGGGGGGAGYCASGLTCTETLAYKTLRTYAGTGINSNAPDSYPMMGIYLISVD